MLGKKRRLRSMVLLSTLLFGCATSMAQKKGTGGAAVTEEMLGALDLETYVGGSLIFSADGRHAIWLNRSDGQYQFILDGKAVSRFDGTYRRAVLSPDGR